MADPTTFLNDVEKDPTGLSTWQLELSRVEQLGLNQKTVDPSQLPTLDAQLDASLGALLNQAATAQNNISAFSSTLANAVANEAQIIQSVIGGKPTSTYESVNPSDYILDILNIQQKYIYPQGISRAVPITAAQEASAAATSASAADVLITGEVEESQCGERLVDHMHGIAAIDQMKAEQPEVVGGRLGGRAVQELSEDLDAVDISPVGLGREVAQGHVVDQALAQRADGGVGHGGLLSRVRWIRSTLSRHEGAHRHGHRKASALRPHSFAATLCCAVAIMLAMTKSTPVIAKEGLMDKLSIPLSKLELYDTSPIEVELAGHKMIIPRNYIAWAGFSDNSLGLQLYAIYPDFQGATRENYQKMQFLTGAKTPDVVTITRFSSYDLQREFRASVSAAARRFGEPTEYEGLVIVKEGFKNAEGHIRAGYSYYVHKSDKEIDDVIIHCTSDTMNLHSCMVDVKFFEGVAFEYDFFFSHLKNWQEIYQKSNALLHSFME